MTTRILSPSDVHRLLPMATCIDRVEAALRVLAEGRAVQPLRQAVRVDAIGCLIGTMPGYLGEPEALGLKAVTIVPGNHGTDLDAHQGVVALFDPRTGVPRLITDASSVTAIRTAAASGVATRALARASAHRLGLIGSGVQAWTHLRAMREVRDIEEVLVFSPDPGRRRAFAGRAAERFGIPVRAVDDPVLAVRGCDLVCTTTAAKEPVLRGAWLEPGCHVNAVGACTRDARELDADAVCRSRVFTDRMESLENEAGDILLAVAEGAIGPGHVQGELGDVLLGRIEGRRSEAEITLYKSLGIAVEDLASAHFLLERAEAEDAGVVVDLAGRREDVFGA